MSCGECEWYEFKNTKQRPWFCCQCELNNTFYELVHDIPGYNFIVKILDWLSGIVDKIEKKIKY